MQAKKAGSSQEVHKSPPLRPDRSPYFLRRLASSGASDSIKATFMTRLANYYRGLNANYRRDFEAYARRSAQSSRQSYRTFFNRVVNDVLS